MAFDHDVHEDTEEQPPPRKRWVTERDEPATNIARARNIAELELSIAVAPDEAYQAAFDAAARERTVSPFSAVLVAHLFPHHQPWVAEALTHPHTPDGRDWLQDCVMSAEQLRRHLQAGRWYDRSLDWHLTRTGATEEQRTAAFESLRAARGKAGGWHHRRH